MAQQRPLRPWVKGLLLAHHYLGLILAPVFLLWFASGMAMVFVPFPEHTRAERLARAPALAAEQATLPPARAWERAAGGPDPAAARVAMRGSRPVYHFRSHGRWGSVFADTGGLVPPLGAAAAADLAAERTGAAGASHQARLNGPDQWTFAARYHGHRPLHRVALNDGRGTVVYLSGRTGETVQRTDRRSRLLAYVGPVAHRLYPEWLRSHHAVWKGAVVGLAGAGAVACLVGLVLGVLTLIDRPRGAIPWRARGTAAWHRSLGLVFGVFAFTWCASGVLAVDPWGWPGPRSALPATLGPPGGLQLAAFERSPAEALAALPEPAFRPRGLTLIQVGERPWYVAHGPEGATRLISARGPPEVRRRLPREALVAAVRRRPRTVVAGAEWLRRPDAHYYRDRATRLTGDALDWPVLRLDLARPAGSRLYLDPRTGAVARRVDAAERRERWLFGALHRLDPPPLDRARWLWLPLVLVLLLGGVVLAGTGPLPWLRRLRAGRRP